MNLIALGVWKLSFNFFGKAITSLDKSNDILLTFDDGPSPTVTPKVLEILKRHNIKALFFLLSDEVAKYPEIVKQIHNDGHQIGSHDMNHKWDRNFRLTKQIIEDISSSCKLTSNITGNEILYYRPPVGLSNPHLFSAINRLNLKVVGWDGWPGDGGNRFIKKVEDIPKLANSKATIILLHDCEHNKEITPILLDSIEKLIINLKENGRNFVTI
jgi:peptidoglycan/xylan/chitin deacetylase (PgdA/CDA1 family)